MTCEAQTIDEYIASIPEERKEPFLKLMATVRENIPEGFVEALSYGFPGFVVPHALYPAGYHCKPEEPLPFISLASQKNFIGFYHMGIYARPDLLEWFQTEYAALGIGKLDRGKSCLRLKKLDRIPYDLLGQLCTKMTVQEWIELYESHS